MKLEVNTKVLIAALKSAQKGTLPKGLNNMLSGVCFTYDKTNDQELRLAATTGNFLIENVIHVAPVGVDLKEVETDKSIESFTEVIHSEIIDEVLKVLVADGGAKTTPYGPAYTQITVSDNRREVIFENHYTNKCITVPTMGGQYPKYNQLIPEKNRGGLKVAFTRAYLKQVLAALDTNKKSDVVTFEFNPDLGGCVNPALSAALVGGTGQREFIDQRILLMPVQLR